MSGPGATLATQKTVAFRLYVVAGTAGGFTITSARVGPWQRPTT